MRNRRPSKGSSGKAQESFRGKKRGRQNHSRGENRERGERRGRGPNRGENSNDNRGDRPEGRGGQERRRRQEDGGNGGRGINRNQRAASERRNARKPFEHQQGKRKVGAKPRLMTPTEWSPKGEGVVRNEDGKRTLIWSGIPNETALVQITHRGQHQQYAHVIKTDEPSSDRVTPSCKRYDRCGGCPFMHIRMSAQDQAKLDMFRRAMDGLEHPIPMPTEVIRAGRSQSYRMVSKLVLGKAKHGALRVGARNRDGAIVPIPDCVVNDSDLNTLGKRITHLISDMEIFPYTPRHPKGMRYVVLRKSSSTGAILVTLVATQRTGWLEDLANAIFRLPLNIQGVLIHVNNEPGNAIFVRDDAGRVRTSTLTGESRLPERVNGIQYWMSAGDFFQVNIAVAAQLQRDVLEHARSFSDFPMVDLYCGAGFFTLPLAKEHGWAMGIELVNGAIQNAKRSALEQNINADFIVGDVFDEVDLVQRKIGDASPFLVVDPARRGLEVGVVEELDAMNPVAIAYVSCHPKSLARDLAAFQALGWTVEDSKVYDMFPNTVHLESLVLLTPPSDRNLRGMTHRPKRVRLKPQAVENQPDNTENPENDDSTG